MKNSPENELNSKYYPFSDKAMDALDEGIGLVDQGFDLNSDEIEKILKDFSDEEKEEIRISIGLAQSIKDLPLPTMSKEAKKRAKKQMMEA
ncbi:MAG: hypothetical protein MUP45_02510 [Candidatus Marinimicrobia bacterium]|nr:hypothetical protein [Candidatus Neomarinimicrobiota bacterium]